MGRFDCTLIIVFFFFWYTVYHRTPIITYCCMRGLYKNGLKICQNLNNNNLICKWYTINKCRDKLLVIKTIYRKFKETYSMLQRTAGVSCSLKQTTEGIWTRLSDIILGSWFHCGIVYGKNECLYVSLDV